MKVKLSVGEFDEIMNSIKEKYRMFAPVLIPYAGQYSDTPVVRYEEVSSIKDIEFNRKSQFTAKEVVMPVTETLFYYNEDNYTIPSIDERKVLVFMIRTIKRMSGLSSLQWLRKHVGFVESILWIRKSACFL